MGLWQEMMKLRAKGKSDKKQGGGVSASDATSTNGEFLKEMTPSEMDKLRKAAQARRAKQNK